MAEVKKIATRESYGNALKELAAGGADNLVVLDADLAGATKTGIFKKAYPDRHFNCGIAEADMMSVAAGLSTMGLVPFASSFAMFAAGRAFEQVRNSIGVVTALNPVIGYKNSTKIAKEALATGRGVYDLVLEHGILSKEELDTILKPENMIRPVKLNIKPRK